jgi:Raf kinase inhibitor-like YbhB/YbcL family protein
MRFLILTALLFVLALTLVAGGVEQDMKNLEVRLGYSRIPVENTCEGENFSPKIEIDGLNAASVTIIVDDPDAPAGTFTHWLIWNIEPTSIIPAKIPATPTVSMPIKAVQGLNDFSKIGYMGPCPPLGKPHRYLFRVYGLDKTLDLKPGATRRDLENAMRGHVLQQGEAIAIYNRRP